MDNLLKFNKNSFKNRTSMLMMSLVMYVDEMMILIICFSVSIVKEHFVTLTAIID